MVAPSIPPSSRFDVGKILLELVKCIGLMFTPPWALLRNDARLWRLSRASKSTEKVKNTTIQGKQQNRIEE